MNRISDRLSELTQPTGEEPILDVSYPTPRLKIAPWQAIVAALAIIISVLLWLALTSPPDSDQLPALEAAEQIGRASCREREESWGDAGSVESKRGDSGSVEKEQLSVDEE